VLEVYDANHAASGFFHDRACTSFWAMLPFLLLVDLRARGWLIVENFTSHISFLTAALSYSYLKSRYPRRNDLSLDR